MKINPFFGQQENLGFPPVPVSSGQDGLAKTHAIYIAMLQEQKRSRQWANLFRFVFMTFFVVFLMAIYSNQYRLTQAKLTNSQICTQSHFVSMFHSESKKYSD